VTEPNFFDQRRSSCLALPVATCMAVLAGLLLATGCWRSAILSPSRSTASGLAGHGSALSWETDPGGNLGRAEQAFAEGILRLEESDPNATGILLEATALAWQAVCETAMVGGPKHEQAGAVYHASLRKLIESSQRFGQLDPRRGLTVTTAKGPTRIPIQYHAFPWQPEDCNRWIPVGEYEDERLARKHQRTGWKVPLVIVRQRDADERFMTRSQAFSATALLRPAPAAGSGEDKPSAPHVLEVFHPLAVKALPKDDRQSTPLAADLSAPIAWLNQNTPHLNFQAYLHPDRQHSSGQLIMLEPYQQGKIPVIFVQPTSFRPEPPGATHRQRSTPFPGRTGAHRAARGRHRSCPGLHRSTRFTVRSWT